MQEKDGRVAKDMLRSEPLLPTYHNVHEALLGQHARYLPPQVDQHLHVQHDRPQCLPFPSVHVLRARRQPPIPARHMFLR